jgi:L-lactate dehydrogenase (cytochrome)
MIATSIAEHRERARRRLPRFLFDYVDGGAYGEATLRANVKALEDIALRQRVMRDVSTIDPSTDIFGQRLSMPIILSPVGLAGLYARRGEVQAARAAAKAGVPFSLSTVSICPIEEVRAASPSPFWFQLYMLKDRAFMRDALARAKAAGCSALIFTVDLPVAGTRYRDFRSGLSGRPGAAGALNRAAQIAARPGWAFDVGLFGRPHTFGNVASVLKGRAQLNDFMGWIGANFDPSVTWKDAEFIRAEWQGPLIIKGILDSEDAKFATDLGADAIVVSNHGGRQLDSAPATAHALPAIAKAVGHRVTVLADGGVRSGLDVLKMLALGARGVLIGRAWAYALASGGEAGVTSALTTIESELRVAMALTGVTRITDINASVLAPLRGM